MPTSPANISISGVAPTPLSRSGCVEKQVPHFPRGAARRTARLRVSEKAIAQVAQAVFTTRAWLTRYGAPYYGINSLSRVVQLCEAAQGIAGPHSFSSLPPGWDARRLGHYWYIFHSAESQHKKIGYPSSDRTSRRARITPELVEVIRREAGGGLERGGQKELAARFGVSESHVSRIINGLRRRRGCSAALTENDVHPRQLGVIAVSPARVDSVFEVLMTVKDWRDHVGQPTYGINDISYVNQKCHGKLWGNSKRPARLPEDWFTIRIGTSWLIYHRSLLPKK